MGVDLRRNFGQDNAILTGLRLARGRPIAIMDDDLQHDPADLPALLAEARGRGRRRLRRLPGQASGAPGRTWGAGSTARSPSGSSTSRTGIYLSPYKVLRREVAELICRYDGPEPYVDGLLFQVTSRFAQVPVEHHPRYAGRSNYNLVAVDRRLGPAGDRLLGPAAPAGDLVRAGPGGRWAACSPLVVVLYRLALPGAISRRPSPAGRR